MRQCQGTSPDAQNISLCALAALRVDFSRFSSPAAKSKQSREMARSGRMAKRPAMAGGLQLSGCSEHGPTGNPAGCDRICHSWQREPPQLNLEDEPRKEKRVRPL